jgi:hypothetical protein
VAKKLMGICHIKIHASFMNDLENSIVWLNIQGSVCNVGVPIFRRSLHRILLYTKVWQVIIFFAERHKLIFWIWESDWLKNLQNKAKNSIKKDLQMQYCAVIYFYHHETNKKE